MDARSTLFFDVAAQYDFWPEGSWPLMTRAQAENAARLFRLASELCVRQGGILCIHDPPGWPRVITPPGPPHCVRGTAGAGRVRDCVPALPVWRDDEHEGDAVVTGDRSRAFYITSGCAQVADGVGLRARVLAHLTAGIRDAVVFGAGLEYGIDRAVQALLRRRIRTHVALDAVGAADAAAAQEVIARWKRETVDGAVTETLRRLLTHP